jgi:hypothetical protein
MLKINYTENESERRWTLHGRLAGPWVNELQSLWDHADGMRGATGAPPDVVIDLRDVDFVDEAGEEVLCAMKRMGARFLVRGVDTEEIVARLDDGTKAPLRKCLGFWACKDVPTSEQ